MTFILFSNKGPKGFLQVRQNTILYSAYIHTCVYTSRTYTYTHIHTLSQQRCDSLLPHDLLWLTCWFLLPFFSFCLCQCSLLMDSTSSLCSSCFYHNHTMTVFWSRAHRQRHVATCLIKFAVGERNVALQLGTVFASGCVI